jgi:hypothetical protein
MGQTPASFALQYRYRTLADLRALVAEGEAAYDPDAWLALQAELADRGYGDRAFRRNTRPKDFPRDATGKVPIHGWLGVYYWASILKMLGFLAGFLAYGRLFESLAMVLFFICILLFYGVLAYGLVLIHRRDHRAPTFWRVASAVELGAALALSIFVSLGYLKAVAIAAAWLVYWIRSRRVSETFSGVNQVTPVFSVPVESEPFAVST